jgi:hypothetical protein
MEKVIEWCKKTGLTLLMEIVFISTSLYAIAVDWEKINTIKAMFILVAFSLSGLYLAEKFIFVGWNINEKIKNDQSALPPAVIVMSLAMVLSAIIGKVMP